LSFLFWNDITDLKEFTTFSQYSAANTHGFYLLLSMSVSVATILIIKGPINYINVITSLSILFVGVFTTDSLKLNIYKPFPSHHQTGVTLFVCGCLLSHIREFMNSKKISHLMYIISVLRWLIIFIMLMNGKIKYYTICIELWMMILCTFGVIYKQEVFNNLFKNVINDSIVTIMFIKDFVKKDFDFT
jgi:hypothetical protein